MLASLNLIYYKKKSMGADDIKKRYNDLKFVHMLVERGQRVILNAKDKKIVTAYERVMEGKTLLPSTNSSVSSLHAPTHTEQGGT